MQTKVYMSRSSMYMADDVNAPNPDTFILPDTLAEFVNIVCMISCLLEGGIAIWENI